MAAKKTEKKEKAFTPYEATVTATVLNVRAGASMTYAVKRTVKHGDSLVIIEEKNGFGKLKGGTGWVNLTFVKKA